MSFRQFPEGFLWGSATVSYQVEGAWMEQISAPGWGRTEMDWGINPPGLTTLLLELKENYGNPKMYITENGCAVDDIPDENGFVADAGPIIFCALTSLPLTMLSRRG
jgi:beta-glucosidase/6-phospho-beta-glucosidase/beta-galactosidase